VGAQITQTKFFVVKTQAQITREKIKSVKRMLRNPEQSVKAQRNLRTVYTNAQLWVYILFHLSSDVNFFIFSEIDSKHQEQNVQKKQTKEFRNTSK